MLMQMTDYFCQQLSIAVREALFDKLVEHTPEYISANDSKIRIRRAQCQEQKLPIEHTRVHGSEPT